MQALHQVLLPVEVTDMTRSRGSWEGEGGWGRRGEKQQSKLNVGGWWVGGMRGLPQQSDLDYVAIKSF